MIKNKTLIDAFWIVLLLVVSRLVPHWPNVTALGATVLLAPRWFRDNKLVLLVPLVAMLVSDSLIGFHETMIYTYSAVFMVSWLSLNAKETSKLSQWVSWGLFSSLSFFVITNFGVWLASGMYAKSLSGLILCYWNALPFLGYEMLGTSLYLAVGIITRQLWVEAISSSVDVH
ncbi:MAG: hypothetical protein RJB66_148 [Pseudomonadota bacterium]|jgi:hypothetical protein